MFADVLIVRYVSVSLVLLLGLSPNASSDTVWGEGGRGGGVEGAKRKLLCLSVLLLPVGSAEVRSSTDCNLFVYLMNFYRV